jgi:cytochrome c-type biogenesis protein CcmH/NrfF
VSTVVLLALAALALLATLLIVHRADRRTREQQRAAEDAEARHLANQVQANIKSQGWRN